MFSWPHAPFVFSIIQPYPLVAISVFFYLEFAWGGAPPPFYAEAFPSPSTLVEVVLHPPSPANLHNYSSRGECPSPLSRGAFHMTVTVTSFLLSKDAGLVLPLLTSPAGLFIYSSNGECPTPTLRSSGHPALFATCLFFFQLLVYYSVKFSFSLFYLGGGHSIQGAMLICPRVVCGSTACCLAHLVLCFSQAG
jgi:hypothetical protein